jgi:hypothetical protein
MDQFKSAPGRGSDPGVLVGVRRNASAQLSIRKDRAMEGLGTVAHAARQTTRQLRDQHHDYLASYVEKAADHLKRVTAHLKEKEIGELVEEVQKFARRHPAVFIGSAFALGFFCSRFLRGALPVGDEPPSADRATERTGHEWTETLR